MTHKKTFTPPTQATSRTCPYCKAHRPKAEIIDAKRTHITMRYTCILCGRQWTEHHALTLLDSKVDGQVFDKRGKPLK